jgi:hypothetical protein
LANHRELLDPMRWAALEFARSHTWARRADKMSALYQEIASAHRSV